MKPLAITLGDPAGIGAEIVFKALQACPLPARVFGSRAWAQPPAGIDFVDVGGTGRLEYGRIDAAYGRVSLAAIDAALGAIARRECSALVTAPIHKQAIALAGSPFPGHTELLAHRAGLTLYGQEFAMYFESPNLRTVLLTVHMPLREAIGSITAESITSLARLADRELRRLHGQAPRIVAAGVNPHAGEGGRFGNEETEIRRGVEEARARGIDIEGPRAADTAFLAVRQGRFDVVLSMYHDQGLIPIKTLDFQQSVNVTLGLPYLRVSVDHGTAFDIAGKGIADDAPMQYAIEWAARKVE